MNKTWDQLYDHLVKWAVRLVCGRVDFHATAAAAAAATAELLLLPQALSMWSSQYNMFEVLRVFFSCIQGGQLT